MKLRHLAIMLCRLVSLIRKLIESYAGSGTLFFLGRKTRPVRTEDLTLITSGACNHPTVDVIVSLYNFKRFTELLASSLNGNACSRTRFVFVLADGDVEGLSFVVNLLSPSVKFTTIVCNRRVGIYTAWNLAIEKGRLDGAVFFTNLNADDLRRPGAICFQATQMAMWSANVCYSDSIITNRLVTEWSLWTSADRVSQVGAFAEVDLVLYSLNKPHCAPMWRAGLHDALGLFREDLESSGDAEFWLRCLKSGIKFQYIKQPLVAYYRNPEGISTGLRSKGFSEWNRILLDHSRSKDS